MNLITFEDKVNNPELLAIFQALAPEAYISAEDINEIKKAILWLENELNKKGCITASCVEQLPTFDNEELASSLANFTPYKTSTGELRYKLPTVVPPSENWVDTSTWIDTNNWID